MKSTIKQRRIGTVEGIRMRFIGKKRNETKEEKMASQEYSRMEEPRNSDIEEGDTFQTYSIENAN